MTRPMVPTRRTAIRWLALTASWCAIATGGCGDGPSSSRLSRLEPVLRGNLDHVASRLPDDEGFTLTISPSATLHEPMKARVSVHGAGGRDLPHHLFGCHDTKERTLHRSPAVTITPGTTRFCTVFVPSAARVRRIVLHPEGRGPFDVYRKGDPLGPVPGIVIRPPRVEPRLPKR